MSLFTIEFDHTILNGSSHNICMENKNSEAQWDLVKNIAPVGGPDVWRSAFQSMLWQGHEVAIVSSEILPHIYPRYLEEVIGLTKKEVEQIKFIPWLPYYPELRKKNQAIQDAIDATPFVSRNGFMIGASCDNVTHDAYHRAQRPIFAYPDRSYLSEIIELNPPVYGLLKELDNLLNPVDPEKKLILERNTAFYNAAMNVAYEARAEINKLVRNPNANPNFQQLEDSLKLAIRVVEDPHNAMAVTALDVYAVNNAKGKSSFGKKLLGAIACLVGIAIVGLSIAGIPFTGGSSLIGMYLAGTFFTTAGLGLFGSGTQKKMSRSLSDLAETADNIIPGIK